MKKRKSPGPVLVAENQSRLGGTGDHRERRWVGGKPLRSSATGPPSGSGLSMGMPDTVPRARTRGRLNRAVLAMLGKGLEDCFDEVRKQEVPERFKLLLQRF
ncbi:MAG TPA: hypothetical protein VGL31_00685 [Xanthobacteraceae bacterium]|jgi:hypothetical protein